MDNTTLEASGENFMTGGAIQPQLNDNPGEVVPSDIEFKRNWVFKADAWNEDHADYAGKNWDNKNLFELKNWDRVWVHNNVFENSWADAQSGYAFVMTPRIQSGTSYRGHDVTIENNLLRSVCRGFNLSGTDSGDSTGAFKLRRAAIRNNALQNVALPLATLCNNDGTLGNIFTTLNGAMFMDLSYNTASSGRRANYMDITAKQQARNRIVGNILDTTTLGWAGSGFTEGNSTMAAYMPDSLLTLNVFVAKTASNYSNHAGNYFPATSAAVRYVNQGVDDRLCTGVNTPVEGCPGASDYLGLGADMTLIPTVPGSLTGHNPAEQSAYIHTVTSMAASGPCDGTAASDQVVGGTFFKSDIEIAIGSAGAAAVAVPIQSRTETSMTIRMPSNIAGAYNVAFWRAGFAAVRSFTCT